MDLKKGSNILFIAPIYLPGHLTGAEVITRDLAETLKILGYRTTVVSSNVLSGRSWYDPLYRSSITHASDEVNGVRIVRLPSTPVVSLALFIINKVAKSILFRIPIVRRIGEWIEVLSWGPIWKGFERAVADVHPDIVVLSPFPAGICLSGYRICQKHHIPYAVIPFFKKDQALFSNRLLGDILDHSLTIYTSTHTERRYLEAYTKNTRIRLLPSSIDRTFILAHRREIEAKANAWKRRHTLSGKKIVLFAGNKGVGKGIIDAAKAVNQLNRRDVILITMGNNTPVWNAYLENHGSNIIRDIPYKTGIEKYVYFALCDVLILPSRTDNFPLVFLEAWQFRKPVLAYEYYSMKELTRDGSGFLAKPGDLSDLANKLKYILDHPAAARKAGSVGYKKIVQYSRERIVRDYFLKGL